MVFVGEAEQLEKTAAATQFTFLLALALLFMVLASQFNSFLQPFYMMLAVPLGIVGGIAALWLSGSTLNIYSGIGLVLLIGLVAKNSILLVDLTNQRRDQGLSVDDALRDACPTRMRPVVMTSLTIILALMPAAIGLGAGAETNKPLSLAVIGGMITSTLAHPGGGAGGLFADRRLARAPARGPGSRRGRRAGAARAAQGPIVALGPEARSLAVFCDFENVALGVKEARYAQFDMAKVLERLLAKGSIVVKKAYCDWERYKEFKATMHSASFELIEIPHVRQSGKNSADIRMVVDALDLCYTKSHVDTFVIVSGDSDFSPLVSKLRENAKTVIGVGVKNSSSDLLINNCDEFIYYDDLVRADEQKRRAAKKRREAAPVGTGGDKGNGGDKKQEAFDLMLGTLEALMAERDADERIWGSMVKQALKRRNPGFNESYYGFHGFSDLLEEAEKKGLIKLEADEKSGGYVVRPA